MNRDTDKVGYTLAALENAAGQVWASNSDSKLKRVFRVAKKDDWIPSENGSQRVPTVRTYQQGADKFTPAPKRDMRKATNLEVMTYLKASSLARMEGSKDVRANGAVNASILMAKLIADNLTLDDDGKTIRDKDTGKVIE